MTLTNSKKYLVHKSWQMALYLPKSLIFSTPKFFQVWYSNVVHDVVIVKNWCTTIAIICSVSIEHSPMCSVHFSQCQCSQCLCNICKMWQ